MKKFFLIVYLVLGLSSLSNAVTIDYDHILAADGTLTSSFAGAMIETFDNPTKWAWTGGGHIVSGSLSGKYAAPYNSAYMPAPNSTKYISSDPLGYYSTTFATTYTYFGLFWGSIDGYNTLSFYNGNNLVGFFTGTDITNPGQGVNYGNQSAPSTNLYVNFYDLPQFDRIVMASSGYAFEADNLAVGNMLPTPEPATMILFGVGLLGLARIGRKNQ